MKAAVVTSFDRPPQYGDFPDPIAGEGEVLVDVKAAGLHPLAKSVAAGRHYSSSGNLPFVPGADGVGRIPNGKRVYFIATRPPYGTFAEKTVSRPGACILLPNELDDITAAALANPGMSSRVALMRAQFAAGENVLILGATGVAGRVAVQMARRLGAHRVVAVGRDPGALAELSELGADLVISLNQERDPLVEKLHEAVAEAKINVVLDYLWGQPAEAALQAIAQKGLSATAPRVRFVQIGSMAGEIIPLPAATLRSSRLELLGSGFGSSSFEQIMQAINEVFQEAAKKPFQMRTKAASLREVESLWSSSEQGTRLAFVP
jgi:NADPH2:quinone reductase